MISSFLHFVGWCVAIYMLYVSVKPVYYLSYGKNVFMGMERSGKTLLFARIVENLIKRNAKWKRKYGIDRPIVTNISLSEECLDYARENDVRIEKWSDLSELVDFEGSDILIDEAGTYFDSLRWEDLTLNVRLWLAQTDKLGNEIYATAQDFAQVHKSFRRLTNNLYNCTKLMGSPRPGKNKPPVNSIWGMTIMTKLDPKLFDEQGAYTGGFLKKLLFLNYFFIQERYTNFFDTNARVKESSFIPYRHVLKKCEECGFEKVHHS